MFDRAYRYRVNHRIAEFRLRLALLRLQLALKANFNPLQHRDRIGQWDRVSFEDGGSGERSGGRTGDPKIDRTTDDLVEIARNVANGVKGLRGFAFGVAVHTEFAKTVRQLNLPGIGRDGVETSFSLGDTVRYGFKDGIRTDVIKRDGRTSSAPIIAVWDVKTGEAKLTPARTREIRKHLNIDESVPIFEIHVVRGATRKSADFFAAYSNFASTIGGMYVA